MIYLSEVEKTALQEFTTRVKSALKYNIREIKLFGSKSTGRFHEDSDIDVLVVIYKRDEKVFDLISESLLDVELKYDALIPPVVLTYEEFSKDSEHNTIFYQEIARDGVTI